MESGKRRDKRCRSAVPSYQGREWIGATLPEKCQPWLPGKGRGVGKDLSHHRSLSVELQEVIERDRWRWPEKDICFISDLHADTDAFVASLVASGGIRKTGRKIADYKLTKRGRRTRFLIGGDCFDKGPSSLSLLRAIRQFMDRGARVRILAGNHDVRMLLGIQAVDLEPDPRTDHFFIRMGSKVIPLLREISGQYLQGGKALRGMPDERECRERLYPPQSWFSEFPRLAGWFMPDSGIERELKRLRKKMSRFEADCAAAGLSMRVAYAAARKWQQLFLHPKGEFYWFFDCMKLAHRDKSFLFIHAGLDDRIARVISEEGIKHLNREFCRQVRHDPFEFYYGPLANTIRTKYRETDMPLTRRGVELVRGRGIHAVVHGHLIRLHGQRIMLRKGMVNFECDATLDRNTRKREGLKGPGAAATLIQSSGLVVGVSCDYPYVKVFDPRALTAE